MCPNVDHRSHKRLNNRAENAHQPTRRIEKSCNSSAVMSFCNDTNALTKATSNKRLINHEQERTFTSRSYPATTKKRIKAKNTPQLI